MELTREQIKEGNEKLAKLIGWYQEEMSISGTWYENTEFAKYVAYSIHNNYPHQDLPFHRDWNYLMKVVDKIGYLVYQRNYDITPYNWKEHYSYMELFQDIFNKWIRSQYEGNKSYQLNLMNDIEGVWMACVAWIDWYNTENKEDEI